ncbi:hypothetical protein GCM10010174_31260 [Kutzneria viridogrisea]|uniref:Uncharacterized protein n=2 Tax=Kutzneria TaxID=43356 RepID=W5W5Q2_9PSEU|nr:DUF2304 domain-containing protein [Kutzneria albida]AHH93529.1 hypothetical protein KALB_152 [Kutzneria albida DSM 43870]MBA8929085.1 hypothetical protein [Kutzneria viridogrisea]
MNGTTAYIVGIIGSVIILGLIIELLRRRQLTEKYAVLWLVIGIIILVLTCLGQDGLTMLAHSVGFYVPSNLLFFLAILFLLGVTLHLSWELSRVEDETRKLAEDLAILRLEVEQLTEQRQGERRE